MEKKVMKRDMFAELMTLAREAGRADLEEFLVVQIEQLDRRAAKAKERRAEKKAEGDALESIVAAALTENLQTAADITAKVAEEVEDVTKAKVVYRAGQLVKAGEIFKTKVDKVVAYTAEAPADAEVEAE